MNKKLYIWCMYDTLLDRELDRELDQALNQVLRIELWKIKNYYEN